MADTQAIADKSRAGWHGFCKFLTFSTLGVLAALGLMGIFLL